MADTVFDILINNPGSDDSSYLSAHQRLKKSLCEHLQRLLNSRRESLRHLPEFGMPDIAALYLDLPYTREIIINAILYAVQTNEPRLLWPRVQTFEIKPGRSMTHFQLIGKSRDGHSLRFTVTLCRTGQILVRSSEDYPPDE